MRNHLIAELEQIAAKDPRTVVLTADLGYGVLDKFARRFPGRFVNVGICEQNMTAVAAGLALEGNLVYNYSIGNFPVMRCLEQIRNCICYHDANVKIVAVGGGFAYGQSGMSHHATEDIAITRALPNMRVFCPADPDEAVAVVRYVHSLKGPCYVRLARGGEPQVHPALKDYDVAKIMELRQGERVAVVTTGSVLSEALSASDSLEGGGKIGVYNCIALKPFDMEGLLSLAERYSTIITVEEHNVIGGLGSIVAETIASHPVERMPRLIRLGLPDVYASVVGSQAYLRRHYGLSAESITQLVRKHDEKSAAKIGT